MFEEWDLTGVEVGDIMFYDPGRSMGSPSISPVARVMKRFIELEDGTQCNLTGSAYPHIEWSTSRVRRVREEDYVTVFRSRAISKIRMWILDLSKADDETLARVYDAIRGIDRRPRK